VRRAAEELQLPLIEIETNLRLVSDPHVLWGTQYHGAALASVGLLVGTRFSEILIPATHSYRDLLPWGSHPLLDPLWSTEAVEFVHDGAVPRPEKLATIADFDIAMRHLRVCFRKDASDLNCGRCEKCLRTMAALRMVGALERCARFPDRLPLRKLAVLPVKDANARAFTRENLAAAVESGDQGLVRGLRWMARFGPLRGGLHNRIEAGGRTMQRRRKRMRRRARRLRRRVARRLRRTRRRVRRRLRRR
jgi:hypothetical protein